MQASTDSVGHPVSVLFGPQCSNVDETSALISKALAEDSSLQFINEILQELPSFWSDITKALPSLCKVSGDEQIIALVRHLHGSPSPPTGEPKNVILTPLTVLSQIMEFIKLREFAGEQYIIDTQGFCVGFLAAIVAASAKDDLQSLTATIIRLAVCIGALVDLDELNNGAWGSIAVRWRESAASKEFQQAIASHPKVIFPCSSSIYHLTKHPIRHTYLASWIRTVSQ
jgi:hypothetical protein